MRQLVRQWKRNLALRTLTLEVIEGVPGRKNFVAQIKRVQDYVRNHIAFVKDINGIETVHTPEQTIKNRAGDCDDQSVLVAAMLESIGHPTRFVAVSTRPFGPYVHVFVETKVGAKWLSVETTEDWPIGYLPPFIQKRMEVHN